MKFRKQLMALSLLGLSYIGGCAFGDRHIHELVYDGVAISEKITNPNEKLEIWVGNFKNRSKTGNIIGCVRNGYGMKTAKVIVDNKVKNPIGKWIRKAFIDELKRAGCEIEDYKYRLEGEVNEFYTDMMFIYDTRLALSVRIYKDGRIVYRDAFHDSSTMHGFWASCGEYKRASNKSLENILRVAVPRIITKLEQLNAEN